MATLPPSFTAARALASCWQDAWNRHDIPSLAALVAPQADFVTVAGVWLVGVEEFMAHHRSLHDGQMRDSWWTTLGVTARALHASVAIAHVEWAIAGDRDPDGTPRQGRRGHFTWVLHADPGWLIAAAQNTNYAHRAAPRLSVFEEIQP